MPYFPGEKYPLTIERTLRDKAKDTVQGYLIGYNIFEASTGITVDGLLEYSKAHDPVEVLDLIHKGGDQLPKGSSRRFNYEIALRSLLRHNGYNSLPRSKIQYVPEVWHRGFKPEEIRETLGYLDTESHKLYVIACYESGLRARTVLAIKYRHIREDLEAKVTPCAIRLDPSFYGKSKSAGFTFFGEYSVEKIQNLVDVGIIKTKADSPILPYSYVNMVEVVGRAMEKAKVAPEVQPSHGLRKHFENALDKAELDHERKMILEGHFAGTRAKHYTDRDWDQLRADYRKAYPFIDIRGGSVEVAQKIQSSEDKILQLEKKVADLTSTLQKLLEKNRGSN